jgi:hypothetical protein
LSAPPQVLAPGRTAVARVLRDHRRALDRFLIRAVAGLCESPTYRLENAGTDDEVICGECLPCRIRLVITRAGLAREIEARILDLFDRRSRRDRRREPRAFAGPDTRMRRDRRMRPDRRRAAPVLHVTGAAQKPLPTEVAR